MTPTIPTIPEIRDQIIADIQAGLGLTSPLLPRSVWRVFATALAGALHLLYIFGAWAYKQIFTATADEEALSLRGEEYGLFRVPAAEWRGTLTATGQDNIIIPAGVLWASQDGQVYQQVAAVQISGGVATAAIFALEPGEAGRRENADELSLAAPLPGVVREGTISGTTQQGHDEEPLEDFRSRILFRQAAQPQGGAKPDYIMWATEVPGIAEAYVDSPTPGVVNVYPLLEVVDPVNRIPGGPELADVTAYLNEDIRRPLGPITTQALAFSELEFDVDISNLLPNNSETRDAIRNAITDYFYGRRPKLFDDDASPRNTISAAQITRVAIDAGAEVATVDLKNAGGTSITSYVLEPYEVCALRTLSWV